VAGGTLAVSAIDGPRQVPVPRVVLTPAPTGGIGASAMPSSAAAPAIAPAGCTVSRLPTDGVRKAVVTGGDPSGRLLAGRLYRASDRNPGGGYGEPAAALAVPG
jgi:hypothetical protein